MREAIALYLRLISAQIKSKLQYRASFVMEITGEFLITFLDFLTIAVILSRFTSIKGWSLSEVGFLYATASLAFSLAQLISRGFEIFERYIQMGELDRVLTRPLSPFFQVLAAEVALRRTGRIGQALVILVISLAGLRVAWDAARIGLFLSSLAAGVVIYLAIFVIGAVTTIWTVSTTEFTNIFTNGGAFLTSYPLTIYEEWFRNFFVFIVPLGFINFLPALIILDKPAMVGLPVWLGWLALPVALVFFGVALLLWSWGLRKYQSTGT
ncbi:MAG TPA: ABC-2 family transporter protein [Chloroflexia bacterium]|nr:ABC-2 family transporter protein [Chloroflexia bacterium]